MPRQVPRSNRPHFGRARAPQRICHCTIITRLEKASFAYISQWANIEQTAKSSIQEKKIRVNFLPLPGQAGAAHMSTPARSSAIGTSHEEEPPAYSSPFSTTATPQRQSTAAVSGPVSTLESRPEGAQNLGEIREGAFNPATLHQQIGLATPVHSQHAHSPQPIQESPAQRAETAQPATSAIAGIVDSIASVLPSAEDVQASLESAKETVGNLVGQGQDHQGMRQRKATDAVNQDANARFGSGHTSMGMQQGAPSGVPVPMVAALCLMCFLVAYLLF